MVSETVLDGLHGFLWFIWFFDGFSYGFPVVFLWFSYGFPMVFLWFSYGFLSINFAFQRSGGCWGHLRERKKTRLGQEVRGTRLAPRIAQILEDSQGLNDGPLGKTQKMRENYGKWPFKVDFPINSMVIFHSYVKLPEGMEKLREVGKHVKNMMESMMKLVKGHHF